MSLIKKAHNLREEDRAERIGDENLWGPLLQRTAFKKGLRRIRMMNKGMNPSSRYQRGV